MTTRLALGRALLTAIAVAGVGGCDFDITNPNSPDRIGVNPSRARVAAAATGLLIGSRADHADLILDLGIIGREAYRFDGSDPRFITELLGPNPVLDAGSGAFGGDHWAEPYRNIRNANQLLAVIGTSNALSDEEKDAVRGFARTIQALDFLTITNTHTQDSIPIAVGTDANAPPAPFATHAEALDHIERLLDSALIELQNGGSAFPFTLASGFQGFDTPADFAKFNRALRARVDVYRQNWAQALVDLQASFVDTLQPLSLGVYHTYSTGSGDFANPIISSVVENFAHPALRDSAQLQPGGQRDRRFLTKTFQRSSTTSSGLTSDLGWALYPTPSTPIPIIRNEELILIRAEANIQLNNLAEALDDINFVRVNSGGLAPLAPFADQAEAINALLYERRYSLLFEGGHRWIDMRRYNRLNQLPIDRPGDVVHQRYPVPTDEILARQ
jgi:hypothetical protein